MGPRELADFAGRWRIARRIEDTRAGLAGRLEGLAEFRPGAGGLTCDERGELRYGTAPPMPATRRTLWRAGAPGRIAVFFDDGRPFHDFALGPAAEAAHDCPPDRYLVAYDFSRWPAWQVRWRVAGPRKDYLSITDYVPDRG
jgi:hypothetical protein